MSAQKDKTVLAATLAVIAVFLLGGFSFTFFPIQQPTQQYLPTAAHIMWTKPPASSINLTITGPVSTGGPSYIVRRYFPMDTVCIDSIGKVNATNGLIRQQENTYTLTGSMINKTILIQKDGIVLDGAGFTLQGWSQTIGDVAIGVNVSNRANVTITNFAISQFTQPISLQNSSRITLSNNNISCGYPCSILVDSSSNNIITGNSISNGILQLDNSSYNTVSNNTMTSGYAGIAVYGGRENRISQNSFINVSIYADSPGSTINENTVIDCSGTGISIDGEKSTVSANTIVNCSNGIYLNAIDSVISKNGVYNASTCVSLNGDLYRPLTGNNTFYHNNFESYSQAVNYQSPSKNADHWDNGTVGNYWSSYNGSDGNGDGIGDSPYVLAANCTDNYPLMQPYTAASSDIELGPLFFAGAVVTALVGAAVIVCVYAKFRRRS